LKTHKLGLPCRRKARFFAKGYRQVKGVDYQESFAPVVRYDSVRVILAIAAARDLELIKLDVTTRVVNIVSRLDYQAEYQNVLTYKSMQDVQVYVRKDNESLAPTAKWGLPFILEWSELYELRPGLYEPLFGAGWLQETSGRPVKLRVVRLVT
jgi:hypothetical protein